MSQTTVIDHDSLATVTGGIINTILDHKPGTDWGKVGEAAKTGGNDVGVYAGLSAAAPGAWGKALPVGITALGAYKGGVDEYLKQQKALK